MKNFYKKIDSTDLILSFELKRNNTKRLLELIFERSRKTKLLLTLKKKERIKMTKKIRSWEELEEIESNESFLIEIDSEREYGEITEKANIENYLSLTNSIFKNKKINEMINKELKEKGFNIEIILDDH